MPNTLKERLEWAMREAPGVSQADLARACGIKQPSVNDWLSGKTKSIKGANLLNASRILGVRPEWLSSGTGHPREGVSLSDATEADALNPRLRRIRIEGAVQMNEQGVWQQGDRDAEETSFPTDDPEAYAIRILSHVFQPVLASGQCIVVSPGSAIKQGRPALVIFMDGSRTLRTYQGHDRGVWTFTKVTDGNAFNTWGDAEVAHVERVMAYLWTD